MLRLGIDPRRRRRSKKKTRRGAPAKAKTTTWKTGSFPSYLVVPDDELPEEDRTQKFCIMIRSDDDPEDTAQGRRNKGERQASRGMLVWRDLNRRGLVSWKEAIWDALSDGDARTFNRIMVEVCDRTADFCGGRAPESALWDLVYAELVEHTMGTPLFFRRADHKSPDGEVLDLEDPRIQLIGVPDGPRE